MNKKIVILVVFLLALTIGLTACNNKQYKQDAVTGMELDAPVTGNGGLVVKQGKHIYYINAYTGADADNTFGKQTKTSLMRAELDADGKLVEGSQIVMVPKNIYSGSTQSGIYIYNNYLYYATPNVDKDKSGNINTVYLDFYRTSIDRTVTELVYTVKGRSADFRFSGGNIIVMADGVVSRIDLNKKNAKKIQDKKNFVTVMERASGFMPLLADNEFGNYALVLQSLSTDDSWKKYNMLYAVDGGGNAKEIISGGVFDSPQTLAVLDYVVESDGLTLYYTKTDSNSKKTLCCYKFANTSFEFDKTKEKQLVREYSGTLVKGLSYDDGAIVSSSSNPYLVKVTAESIGNPEIINDKKAVTVKFVKDGYVYYTATSNAATLYRFKLDPVLNESGNDTRIEEKVCDMTLSTAWIGMDILGDYAYYLDSKTGYTFRVKLAEGQTAELIGLMTPEDKENYEKEQEEK